MRVTLDIDMDSEAFGYDRVYELSRILRLWSDIVLGFDLSDSLQILQAIICDIPIKDRSMQTVGSFNISER